MKISKKIFIISIFSIIISLSTTSCASRRLEYLKDRKEARLVQKKQEKKQDKYFYPDDIDKMSLDQYISRFSSLEKAPSLRLPNPEEAKALTNEQMVEDFEFFFKTIKENYPFLEMLKRDRDFDFLANHDIYLERIKKCKNDREFIKEMEKIAEDLDNQHVRIADRAYVEKTLDYYSYYRSNPSMYREFLNMNKQRVRNRYGLKGSQSKENKDQKGSRKNSAAKKGKEENLTISYDGDMAIIKINEMLADYLVEDDRKKIEEFLENKDAYNKLVIDIRDNAGGNISYRKDFLLPYLLTETKSVTNHMFFKDGKRSRDILKLEKANYEEIEDIDLDSMDLDHKEDLKDFAFYKEDYLEVKNKEDYGFDKDIYLLVNENVFSAAEGLASFAKNTGFAKLVGKRTGGDGITLGLINDFLPNSGLVFTYTNTLGYAPDGTINEEKKTDVDIKSQSYKKSIEIIKNLK